MNKTLPEDFAGLRNQLLNDALLWISIATVPGVAFSVARVVLIGWKPLFFLHLMLLAALWLLWMGRGWIAYRWRVFGLLAVTWLAIFAGFVQLGPIAFGGLHAILFAFIAILFLNGRVTGWLIAGNTLCLMLFGLAASKHWLTFDLDYQVYAHHPLTWASAIWTMTAYAIILALIGSRMVQGVLERETVARELAARQLKIATNVPGVIYQLLCNRSGTVSFPYISEGSRRVLGIDPALLTADAAIIFSLIHPDDLVRIRESIQVSSRDLTPCYESLRIVRPQQNVIWVEINSTPERLANGDTLWHGFMRDITSLKIAETALKQAKLDAEFASRAKSEFLTHMSHELRTPLNAIIGFSQLLEMDKLTPADAKKEAVGHIVKSGRLLLNLINEILDLARIESGKPDFKIETFALLPLIDETVSLSLPAATLRNVVIRYSCPGEIRLSADLSRVRQILLNLLSNAIKYNRQCGSVTLSCTVVIDYVRVTIADTGTGISNERRSEIFQPFNRLGAEKSNIEGTGIGLIICKRLIEGMGGRIGFDSDLSIGSQFWFELPYALSGCENPMEPSIEIKEDASNQQRSTGKCVLYIEDSPVNVDVMKNVFHMLPDIELLTAENAEIGLAMIHQAKPDLVLMDINLPGTSGLEALKILKSDPATWGIPVIAVSAAAMADDVEAGLKAGFLAYLTKPFEVPELIDLVRKVLQKPAVFRNV